MPESTNIVDSWAVIAWLLDQRAAPMFESFLREADAARIQLLMSWINVGEVYYIVVRRHGVEKAEAFLKSIPALPIRVVLPTDADVIAAARLRSSRRLSYADAFAAALAIREGAAVITGDPELRALSDILSVEWIG